MEITGINFPSVSSTTMLSLYVEVLISNLCREYLLGS